MSRFATLPPSRINTSAIPGGPYDPYGAGPIVTADGLRRSIHRHTEVITPDQIPLGAKVVRIDNPAQYITHDNIPAARVDTVTTSVRPTVRQQQTGGCPWWVWLIVGIIGLLLLGGFIYSLVRAFGDTTAKAAKNVAEGAAEVADDATDTVADGAKAVGKAGKKAAKKVKQGAEEVADTTADAANEVKEGAKDTAEGAADATENAADNVAEGTKKVARGVHKTGKAAARGVKDAVSHQRVWRRASHDRLIENAASGVYNGVAGVGRATSNAVSGTWYAGKNAVRSLF